MSPATKQTTVIVVSNQRHDHLKTCLTALVCQNPAQVVVVGDAGARMCLPRATENVPFEFIAFTDWNISGARNKGLELVHTPFVAFIDDDAVPCSTWLDALVDPLRQDNVQAATGFVRTGATDRWQFRGEQIDARAVATPLPIQSDSPVILRPPENAAILTIGTNCAFRADALFDVQGFDPIFRYFLDESDLNMRMAKNRADTAVVPDAVVRHYLAPGRYRRPDGQLRDLTEIGASLQAFIARHAPREQQEKAFSEACEYHRHGLLRAMIRGDLEPRDVNRGLNQLRRGAALGQARLRNPDQIRPGA